MGLTLVPLKPAEGFLPVDDGLPSATALSRATGATVGMGGERGFTQVTSSQRIETDFLEV